MLDWYRSFNQKYSVAGNLMLAYGAAYLLSIILLIALGETRYNLLFNAASLPMDLGTAVQQPWSIFTFWLVNHPVTLWMVLGDIAILFGFGMLLQTIVGRERFKWLVVSYISAVALLTLLAAQFLPTIGGDKPLLFGMHGVNIAIILTCVMMAPRLRVKILNLWEVELVWVGLTVVAFSLIGYRAVFTVIGTSIFVGILTGTAVGYFLRRQNSRVSFNYARPAFQQQTIGLDRVRVREVRPNPQHKGKFTVVGGPSNVDPEDELDKLLDRINEVGYEGLSHAEKKRLEELSK